MPLSEVNSRYARCTRDRLFQGDILRDIEVLARTHSTVTGDDDPHLDISTRLLPYVVVLTQDCDLDQDYSAHQNANRRDNDKFLLSVLICPAYPAALVKDGKHLEDHQMQILNSNLWKPVKSNHNSRYHFLEADNQLQVPEVVLDFKQYFTVSRDEIYEQGFGTNYVATINTLFRESLSRRFAEYLTRIALPEFPASVDLPVPI